MGKDIKRIFEGLRKAHGGPRVELKFSNPLELLVATVLSAQCPDERVNRVTVSLFQKYKSLEDYIRVSQEELERDISSINFYRNKAKTIKGVAKEIKEKFEGKIPHDIEILAKFKGIGRKSANMIVGCAFGKPAIIVDTHLKRVTKRLGLSSSDVPETIEKELKDKIPMEMWTDLSLLFILHGRYICTAKEPRCLQCVIKEECDYFKGTHGL